ncbi:hypothetical protein AXG93_3759s1000 [Marchantia polymorpha subsp. ruderalis]|uniref:Uncharacterized protein n=1 Tax=Marchantia polymorpha subsp. ruderalis TaxID=1480154 RepID=A0A176VSN6_MARPO|nr:hypothetical protein AXG93_3759s1000 [Marchantia polymorpha subsp. ruderalis]
MSELKYHLSKWGQASASGCTSDTRATRKEIGEKMEGEEKRDESTLQVVEEGPSAVPAEVRTEVTVEPSEKRTEICSSSFTSLEQTRFVGSEDVPQRKTNEELAKELTLSEKILEQIVARVGETMGNSMNILVPPPLEEEVRSEVAKNTSEMKPKKLEVSFPDFF